MKYIISTLIALALSFNCDAQNIRIVKRGERSDIKVYVTNTRSRADLCVYRVGSPVANPSINDGVWFFVKGSRKADKVISFEGYSLRADLIVYFVQSKAQAGWCDISKQYLLY